MPLDPTNIMNQPWVEMLKPFTDLLGNAFYLLIISVVGGALYLQKKDVELLALYFITMCSLASGANIFFGYLDIVPLYVFIVGVGLAYLIINPLFGKKT